jgi:anhydro-N-acetylmuramic acid kinase
MSGTSMDGIDAALVSFADHQCRVAGTRNTAYPDELRQQLLDAAGKPAECTIDRVGQLDRWVGECFRDAALALIEQSGAPPGSIAAIGSHGQTLRHQPRAARPFSLQIGDANVIAAGTGITVVADFRRRDIALGGEGAPLAPAFHRWLFAEPGKTRAILNIGGIANVTMLTGTDDEILGFDTGPGNTLLDGWIRDCRGDAFDESGNWAREGAVAEPLLAAMLDDPYFAQSPPKSTGFEYFNRRWLRACLSAPGVPDVAESDVQATLSELTARTIATSILGLAPVLDDVLVCGGGVHNADLMRRLGEYLTGVTVTSTERFGLDPDWVEAAAFAWLAMRRLQNKPGNLPSVTGATRPAVLGAIFPGTG